MESRWSPHRLLLAFRFTVLRGAPRSEKKFTALTAEHDDVCKKSSKKDSSLTEHVTTCLSCAVQGRDDKSSEILCDALSKGPRSSAKESPMSDAKNTTQAQEEDVLSEEELAGVVGGRRGMRQMAAAKLTGSGAIQSPKQTVISAGKHAQFADKVARRAAKPRTRKGRPVRS
jgi:hypothetical protein